MRSTLALLALVALAAGAQAQFRFPYCRCQRSPSAYSLVPLITSPSPNSNRFCFTLKVDTTSCPESDYCCSEADLRKIEFDVNPECVVFGATVSAYVNDVVVTTGPSFDKPKGYPGKAILRLVNLGLGLEDDGAEICIELNLNKNGKGCDTLETLCATDGDYTCKAALFDKDTKCCPVSEVSAPCDACLYFQQFPGPNQTAITSTQCQLVQQSINEGMAQLAAATGANIIVPFGDFEKGCGPQVVTTCGQFASDADGALITNSPDFQTYLDGWVELLSGQTCAPGTSYAVTAGGRGGIDAPVTCLEGFANSQQCALDTCESCVFVDFSDPKGTGSSPIYFDAELCASVSAYLEAELATLIADAGVTVVVPYSLTSCNPLSLSVCGELQSDASIAALNQTIQAAVTSWITGIIGNQCPPYLKDFIFSIKVAGITPEDPGCVQAEDSIVCSPITPPSNLYPKCKCATKPYVSPFFADGAITTEAGRDENTTSYCFTIGYGTAFDPNSFCGKSNSIYKLEFWANEAFRRKITGINLQPVGGDATWLSPGWGAYGTSTLRAAPLNWSKAQANGGKVCLELKNEVSIEEFCVQTETGPVNSCWLNIFDTSKTCCPLYSASEMPSLP